MEKMVKKLLLLLVAIFVLFEGSRAFSFCNLSEEGLTACKPSVTEPNPSDPTQACCQALSALSEDDLKCLCSYKNSMLLPSLGIDPNLAMGLPAKCNITPPADC
ncbi:hypothetical protein UlMin_031953 [Ulmus minor]